MYSGSQGPSGECRTSQFSPTSLIVFYCLTHNLNTGEALGKQGLWGVLAKAVGSRERERETKKTLAPRKMRVVIFVWNVFNIPLPQAKDWAPLVQVTPFMFRSIYIYIQDALNKPNFCFPFKIGCAVHLGYQGFLLLTKSSPCNIMLHFFPEKKERKMFALNLAFQ